MVTVKGTNIGLEGGVFKDSLAKLQQQIRAESNFASLGNDDAFSSNTLAALRSDSGNSAFSDRISDIAGINNDISTFRNNDNVAGRTDALVSRLDELESTVRNTGDEEALQVASREFENIRTELNELGVDTSNLEFNPGRGGGPGRGGNGNGGGGNPNGDGGQGNRNGGDPGAGLPDNAKDLAEERKAEADRLRDLDGQIAANNEENDTIRDRIDELEGLESRTQEQEDELVSLREDRDANRAAFEDLDAQRQFSGDRINAIDERLDALADGGDRAAQLQRELNSNNERLGELETQNGELGQRIENAGARLEEIEGELAAARENPDLLTEEERETLIEERSSLTEQRDGLLTQRRELESSIGESRDEIAQIQKDREALQENVLDSKEQEKIENNIARLEKKIEPLAKRSERLGNLIDKIGEGRTQIGNRLTEIQEQIENGASGDELKALRKERGALRVADKVLAESQEFLGRRRDRIEGRIAGEREEIQAGRDRIAGSDAAKEEIAAGQEREAALNEEVTAQEEQLAGVNQELEGVNEQRDGVVARIDADTEGRQAIRNLEDEQTGLGQQREDDRAQIQANNEEAAALRERNAELQAEIDALGEAGGVSGPEPSNPAEARAELEKRLKELEERQAPNLERDAELLEEDNALAERETVALERVETAQNTLNGLRTNDELDEAEQSLTDEREALIKEDDREGRGQGLRQISNFERQAEKFREKGDEEKAAKFQAKADDIRDRINNGDDEEQKDRLRRFDEIGSELDQVETDRTARAEAEVELSAAQEELGEVQGRRSEIAEERGRLAEQREQDEDEIDSIRDALRTSNPFGDVDPDTNVDELDPNERRELAERASDRIEVNNTRLGNIERRLEELDEEEVEINDRISSLTGRDNLTEEEQEELDELEARLESVANRRALFTEQRDGLEDGNEQLRDLISRARDVDDEDPGDPGDPPGDEDPDPEEGGGFTREDFANQISALRDEAASFSDRVSRQNRVLGDSISSRIDQRSREVTIDIFESQANAVGDADADNLAQGIADQIRNLASQGQGQNAVNAAFAESTDTGRLTDRLRQLFA